MRKLLALVLALMLALAGTALAVEIDVPREETLTFNGNSWGFGNFNIFAMSNQGWPASGGTRMVVYEALYMYNVLTNENEPLLADGDLVWEDELNAIVKIKPAAHWNDGEKLTADDVIFTFNIANEAAGGVQTTWSDIWNWITKVEKVDDYTVRFTIVEEPYNIYMLPSQLSGISIVPEHIWQPIFDANKTADGAYDAAAIRELFTDSLDIDYIGVSDKGTYLGPVASGAYTMYYADDTRLVAIRDDNYWGADESMFGKLPAPKYLQHSIYANNAAGDLAFKAGEVDVAQQFMESVWEIQKELVDENGETLVTTYFNEKPYHLGYGIPSLIFNMTRPGLNDIAVRKAIALCLDYEAIATNAMSGYTEAIIPSVLNPYIYGQYLDETNEEYMALRWDTTDLAGNIEKAKALLDEAGYVDVDGDGFRELPDGGKIEWKAECPDGWSDWNASLEILCNSAKEIGLNIITYFPQSSVYTTDSQTGNFDIVMASPWAGGSVANPWRIVYNVLYSGGVADVGGVTTRNYGRYKNEEVDALIDELAAEADFDTIKEIMTEIDTIYLQELPTVFLMYRPQNFHTTYEGVWGGFGKANDGTNTPPMNCTDYAAIKDLYNIYKK